MQSFSNKKQLRFVITLGTGAFDSSGNNQITLQGYRAIVDIDKAGGMQMGTLRTAIYGVKQSDMNSVTTLLWKLKDPIYNKVQVFAIDGTQETSVFSGWIVQAWGNYINQPDVFLEIQAMSGYVEQLAATPPLSFDGQVDVATVMGQLSGKLGLTFENNGVQVQLTNQYLSNSGLWQARDLANAAGIWFCVDDSTLAIMPAGTPRGTDVPEIGPSTGLVGYPTFDGVGVNIRTKFNPAIRFLGAFKLVTSLPQAAGVFIATSIAHRLESEKPNGAWFSQVRGTKSGLAVSK